MKKSLQPGSCTLLEVTTHRIINNTIQNINEEIDVKKSEHELGIIFSSNFIVLRSEGYYSKISMICHSQILRIQLLIFLFLDLLILSP